MSGRPSRTRVKELEDEVVDLKVRIDTLNDKLREARAYAETVGSQRSADQRLIHILSEALAHSLDM